MKAIQPTDRQSKANFPFSIFPLFIFTLHFFFFLMVCWSEEKKERHIHFTYNLLKSNFHSGQQPTRQPTKRKQWSGHTHSPPPRCTAIAAAMHRQRRDETSSHSRRNIVTPPAMHAHGAVRASSRRCPCIVTALTVHRHFSFFHF